MRSFIDCEFTDLLLPELISVGLVSECGRYEFYAELTDFNRRAYTRFVWKHVLPKLGRIPTAATDRSSLSAALSSWIEQLPAAEIITVTFDFQGDWELIIPLLNDSALRRCLPSHVWGFIMEHHRPPKLHVAARKDAHHALCDARVLRANWLAANAIAMLKEEADGDSLLF